MKKATFISDYCPNTSLTVIQNDDGDVILHIRGNGEMRIATSGGRLHGEELVSVCGSFSKIIDSINK